MAAFDIPEMSSSPPEGCTLKVGDKVRFVNDYGVAFGPFTIQGFTLPTDEIANAAGRTCLAAVGRADRNAPSLGRRGGRRVLAADARASLPAPDGSSN